MMLLLQETHWYNVTYMTSHESLGALKGLTGVLGLGQNVFNNTFNVVVFLDQPDPDNEVHYGELFRILQSVRNFIGGICSFPNQHESKTAGMKLEHILCWSRCLDVYFWRSAMGHRRH